MPFRMQCRSLRGTSHLERTRAHLKLKPAPFDEECEMIDGSSSLYYVRLLTEDVRLLTEDRCTRCVQTYWNEEPLGNCNELVVGYSCTCDAGYAFVAGTCTDTDECADGTHDCRVFPRIKPCAH